MSKYEGFIRFQEYTKKLEIENELLRKEKESLLKENHNLKVQYYLSNGSCCGCKHEPIHPLEKCLMVCKRRMKDCYEEDV